ncbi:MAG TPA: thiamine pyrophosphate-binding protein, partial [Blastocatellia bacterium]|nr:thiamine pyrophosphate-binding protein [Blastocatellia bacterium]
ASEIPRVFARAFQISLTPPTGPVFISLPVDVMEELAEIELIDATRAGSRLRGDRERIEQAARALAGARNPAIIAGDGCARAGAMSELVKLAELLGARVHLEPLNSLMIFPTSHSLFAGPLYPNAKQTRALLEDVDLILAVGANTLAPLVHTGITMIAPGTKLIQIDAGERELGKNYPAAVAIQADPRSALEEIIELLAPVITGETATLTARRREMVEGAIAQARANFIAQAQSSGDSGVMTAGYVARVMREAAARTAVLVDESVTSTAYVRTIFGLSEPNSYFYAKGGSLGLGLPSAVGVKLALKDRQVICAVGDGSALYSIQSLWTAARYDLAVVFVVFNNASYMILKGGLVALGGAAVERGVFPGMDITEPEVDFVRLAESFGVAARKVASKDELRAALDWALGLGGPALVDVAISRDIRSVLR